MIKQKKIILAEPNKRIGNYLKDFLELNNYYVYPIIKAGEELISKAKKLNPSLIIADTMLNGFLDGIEAIYRLTHDLKIPYAFITSFNDDIRLLKSYFLQPLFLIHKPINSINLDMCLSIIKREIGYANRPEFINENQVLIGI